MNSSARTTGILIAHVLLACACETPPVHGVLGDMVALGDLGLVYGVPPIVTGCARVQPGYDPGDPSAEPPVPPTLDGRPYSLEQDGFCTVSFTRRTALGADGFARVEDDIYLLEMGEPDPDAVLAPHLVHLREQLATGPAHYCNFRYRIEAEPLEGYGEEDAQLLTWTLEEVSHFCSRDYIPEVRYVPGFQYQEVVIRSTDPERLLFLPDSSVEPNGGYPYRGHFGIPESGGAPTFSGQGGWMEGYDACELEPTSMGHGVCRPRCRVFSPNADGTLPLCGWSDVAVLPANPGLIDTDWIDAYRSLYDEIFGGS